MITVLYKNNNGDNQPSKVPVRELPKLEYGRIQAVVTQAFLERMIGEYEIATLKYEVKELKKSNQDLATSVHLMENL